MTAPPDNTKARKKHPGLFFLVGCTGCGFLLLLIGVAGTMGWLLYQQHRGERETIPVAWHDSLRARYRLPELVTRLATVPAESGNAWTVIQGRAGAVFDRERMRAVRHLLAAGGLTAEDSAVVRGALRDSTAALAASAARRSRYDPEALLGGAVAPRLMPPLGPGQVGRWVRVGGVTDPLILRGEARRWRGDLQGARQDFAAVIALGKLAWFGETGGNGVITGRRVIESGAAGLARVAAQAHDPAPGSAADSLRAWGGAPIRFFSLTAWLPPESLIVVAQDTALPRDVRGSALENACWGSIYRPFWRLVTGPSGDLRAAVRALAHDADPYVARAAVMADSTLARLDDMGISNRYRVASGKSVR